LGNDGRGVVTVLTNEVVVARGEVVDGAIVLGRKVVAVAVLNERGAVVGTSVVDESAAFLVRGTGEGDVMALFLVRGAGEGGVMALFLVRGIVGLGVVTVFGAVVVGSAAFLMRVATVL
jgi:hypothetical protein